MSSPMDKATQTKVSSTLTSVENRLLAVNKALLNSDSMKKIFTKKEGYWEGKNREGDG